MLRYTERPNFTPEQIEQHITETITAADNAGLEGADRAALLPAIFDKVASKQIMAEQFNLTPPVSMPSGLR